jgi:26S proteasome regulatory subunit N5
MAHQAELEAIPALTSSSDGGGGGEEDGTAMVTGEEPELAAHWRETFRKRVVQHNVRTVALYYRRIRGSRLAQLLQLTGDRLEHELAEMVSSGDLYARIDRPRDVVRFRAPQSPEAVLSDWVSDVDKLLHLVETTTHLIHKENMTASAPAASSSAGAAAPSSQ